MPSSDEMGTKGRRVEPARLLLASFEDGAPTLEEGLELSTASRHVVVAPAQPEYLIDHGDPDDLRTQQWGVIAAAGPQGDEALAAIQPLIDARADEQDADVTVARVPRQLAEANVRRWREQAFGESWSSARYLLILGDLDAVGLELERQLANDALMVGRLPFSRAYEHAAYVEKLLRRARSQDDRGCLLLAPRDGADATARARERWLEPCRALLERRGEGWEVETVEPRASPSALRAAVEPSGRALVSVGHGLFAEDGARASTGALLLADGERLTASELARGAFLPRGAWFMFSSYATACPARGGYARWLRERDASRGVRAALASAARGERGYASRVAAAALANPEGPLAVVGPAGLAWLTPGDEQLGEAIAGAVLDVLGGARIGGAIGAFRSAARRVNAQIEMSMGADLDRAAALWIQRELLSSTIALGDPAVTIADRPRRPRRSTSDLRSLFGGAIRDPRTP